MKRILITGFIIVMLVGMTGCSIKPNIEQTNATHEPSNSQIYKSTEGWTINYPSSWNKVGESYIQEESTGKMVEFYSESCSKETLEKWVESEVNRKLQAAEAGNTLEQALKMEQAGKLFVYSYTIKSKMESSEWLLKNTIFFDGKKRYEFRAQVPPVTEKEYDEIINSFKMTE